LLAVFFRLLDTLSILLETYSTRDLAEKLGKSKGYIGSMSGIAQLVGTLERENIKTAYYHSDKKRQAREEILIQHTDKLSYWTRLS